jgi:preprotein translocase subunit SecA
MFKRLLNALGGNAAERELKRYSDIADQICELAAEYDRLSDAELRAKTDQFRAQVRDAQAKTSDDAAQRKAEAAVLDEIMPAAFATVRAASIRTIGLRHRPVQLIGGQVLHAGRIAEMRTGEGKTLVATLPLYLNALTGRGVHLITVNDYLARRDAKWMGPIFQFLGMQVGILQDAARTDHGRLGFLYDPSITHHQEENHNMRLVSRPETYQADIVYGTNSEFGFDYLRDNMERSLDGRRQRGRNFAIIDEVDNVLIDEARTPLIISGPANDEPTMYYELAQVVRNLRPEHYEIDERSRGIVLTEEGYTRVEELLQRLLRNPDRPEDITPEQAQTIGHLEQALRAEYIFKRNKDYLVQSGQVLIVDEFTGRTMPGRRWSDGLHQAIEAKEGVKVQAETVTYATITIQNFFRMYKKLAGMSGTATTESEEFNKIYGLEVTEIPTNLEFVARRDPSLVEVQAKDEEGIRYTYIARKEQKDQPILYRRKDYDDAIYRTEEAKLRAIVQDALVRHVKGQPLLLGTTSVEMSEQLSHRLGGESLRKLALVWLLRQHWFRKNKREEDGRVVAELEFMNEPLEKLDMTSLRSFARELDIRLNALDPDNLAFLAQYLIIPSDLLANFGAVLESGLQHQVLNAKQHARESLIIAEAGRFGSATIATNMAGRGVDIKLGGEISEDLMHAINQILQNNGVADPYALSNTQRLAALDSIQLPNDSSDMNTIATFRDYLENEQRVRGVGGLHVIGSARHEARRIDNQLRGRAARQGDPGSSRFYLSLGDELMRRFGGSNLADLMTRFKIDEALPLEAGIVNRSIEQAQTRVEGANFDSRKHLLEYDDVLNQQREKFYQQRDRIFQKSDLHDDLTELMELEIKRRLQTGPDGDNGWWKLLSWLEEVQPPVIVRLDGSRIFPFSIELLLDELGENIPNLSRTWAKVDAYHQAHLSLVENLESAEHLAQRDQAQVAAHAALQDSMQHIPAIRTAIIEIANRSMATAHQQLRSSLEAQVHGLAERAKDRARSRRDLAEIRLEGLQDEARSQGVALQPREAAKQMLASAEVPQGALNRDDWEAVNGESLRGMVLKRIEAAGGMETIRAFVQSTASRHKLTIPPDILPHWDELDWNAFEHNLVEVVGTAQTKQTETFIKQIQTVLDTLFTQPEQLTRSALGEILHRIAHNRVTVYNAKHQAEERLVRRFPYVYYAAEVLGNAKADALLKDVLQHFKEILHTNQLNWGQEQLLAWSKQYLPEIPAEFQKVVQQQLAANDWERIQGTALGLLRGSDVQQVRSAIGSKLAQDLHRAMLIQIGDNLWVEYLTTIEGIRTSIGLEAYAQRDPLTAYKRKAFDSFNELLVNLRSELFSNLFKVIPGQIAATRAATQNAPTQAAVAKAATPQPETTTPTPVASKPVVETPVPSTASTQGKPANAKAKPQSVQPAVNTPVRATTQKVPGRNEPCWCGSGKKYKQCHLQQDELSKVPIPSSKR